MVGFILEGSRLTCTLALLILYSYTDSYLMSVCPVSSYTLFIVLGYRVRESLREDF